MSTDSNSKSVLRGLVERIENLESDKANLAEDIREVYKEVKEATFDPKIVRKVIAMRKKDQAKLKVEQDVIESYLLILGVL